MSIRSYHTNHCLFHPCWQPWKKGVTQKEWQLHADKGFLSPLSVAKEKYFCHLTLPVTLKNENLPRGRTQGESPLCLENKSVFEENGFRCTGQSWQELLAALELCPFTPGLHLACQA